jgi:hypothetical protein
MAFFSSLSAWLGLKSLSVWLGVKSSLERLTWFGVTLYALRHKENVAAKCGHGTFEIIATGTPPRKLP